MRSILSLALIGLSTLTSTALAGPNWTGFAGLVDADGDGYPAFVGTSTAASTGYSGDVDCDDTHATRNQGLDEVIGNGIDDDCDAATADTLPVSDPEWKRFIANEYGGRAPSSKVFVYEFDACTAGASATPVTCTVDLVDGRFVVTDGYKLADIFINGSVVLRNSGQKADGREVVTAEQFEHFRGSTSATGTTRGTGVGKSYVDRSAGVLIEADKAETEARLAADVIHDSRLDGVEGRVATIEMGNAGRDESINLALDGVASNLAAIDAETTARIEADRILAANDRALEARINDTDIEVDGLASSGVAVNVGVAGGVNTQRERIVYDESIRGPATGLVGFDASIHVDLDQVLVGPFVTQTWGSDGVGSGSDSASLVGFEGLYDISDSGHHLGGFGAWRHTSAMSNMLDTAVPANGACGGLSYRYQSNSSGPIAVSPWARVGGCGESYADKSARLTEDGSTDVVDGGMGAGMTALGGISFNVTSARDR